MKRDTSDRCEQLRAVLSRTAEGETCPEEALRLARHLPDCTACRIHLAREARLARMLDCLADSIPVEEAFLEEVMRSLPQGPPPARHPRHRGLKLAGMVGLLLGGAMAGAALLPATGRFASLLPRVEFADPASLLEALAGAASVVVTVLDRVGASLALGLPALHVCAHIGVLALLPIGAALVTLSTLVAVVAHTRSRG